VIQIDNKNIRVEIPTEYYNKLQFIKEITDDKQKREIQIWKDEDNNSFMLLETEPIILATYPKGEKLEKRIIVHPRYASNTTEFEFIEVRGFRNGRTIDILMPGTHNGEAYNLLNFKGVGAWADGNHMFIDTDRWYCENRLKWKPLSEVKGSLGRKWGLLSQEEGTKELEYNIFKDSNILQTTHIRLNYMPNGVLPFSEVAQLVRILNTNIRCDSEYFHTNALQRNINYEIFAFADAKLFSMQKELFSENKAIKSIGSISNNRYIDGKLTDRENYSIIIGDEKSLINHAYDFSFGLISSAIVAMSKNKADRRKYLNLLQEKTKIPLVHYIFENPEIFRENPDKLNFSIQRSALAQVFKEDFTAYLKG